MLQICKVNNHYNYKLLKSTKSYNPVIHTYFKNSNEYLNIQLTSLSQLKSIPNNITDSYLDSICKDNPLALFSECTLDSCKLNRLINPKYRRYCESIITELITTKYKDRSVLTYTSYNPGNYLQDIIILTTISKILTNCKIIVNFVNILDFNFIDHETLNNTDLILYKYKICKLLEWFSDISIELNFYKSIHDLINECFEFKLRSDLIIGIDYDIESHTSFATMAMIASNPTSYIVSLRTIDNTVYFNVCQNNNSLNILTVYYEYLDNKTELQRQQNKETILISCEEINKSINTNKFILQDGIKYYLNCPTFKNNKLYLKYCTDNYEQYIPKFNSLENDYNDKMNNEYNKSLFILDTNGFLFDLRIFLSPIKYHLTNCFL